MFKLKTNLLYFDLFNDSQLGSRTTPIVDADLTKPVGFFPFLAVFLVNFFNGVVVVFVKLAELVTGCCCCCCLSMDRRLSLGIVATTASLDDEAIECCRFRLAGVKYFVILSIRLGGAMTSSPFTVSSDLTASILGRFLIGELALLDSAVVVVTTTSFLFDFFLVAGLAVDSDSVVVSLIDGLSVNFFFEVFFFVSSG